MEINVAGNFTANAYFNPDRNIYSSLLVEIEFVIDKGEYTAEELNVYKNSDGEYIEWAYSYGLKLSQIDLPIGFNWLYQVASVNASTTGSYYIKLADGTYQKVTLPTDYDANETYYMSSDQVDFTKIVIGNEEYYQKVFKAVYDKNPSCYNAVEVEVIVHIVKGELNAASFEHPTFTLTYRNNLKATSYAPNSGYEWILDQEGIDEALEVNGEGQIFKMNYYPNLDPRFTEVNGLSKVFGDASNYNSLVVDARVVVVKATYTRRQVTDALGAFTIAPYTYKQNLTVDNLHISLPDGFEFANAEQVLFHGVNEVSVIYNKDSIYNPNYNDYGESLSERTYVDINIVSPTLIGVLDTNSDEVVVSPLNGSAIKKIWNSTLGANGQVNVPFVVTYFDRDLNEQVIVEGSAVWLSPAEVLSEVGYTTRQVLFTAVDKNFTSNNATQVFDVQVLVSGADPNMASLSFDAQTFVYNTFSTLHNLQKVVSTDKTLQYLSSIRYVYQKQHVLGDGSLGYTEESPLTSDVVLDAGDYLITAYFDEGKCRYYDFVEGVSLHKVLTITKATLSPELKNVERTYGDYAINNDSEVTATGIEYLNAEDYTLAVYYDDKGINEVELNYLTKAGTYYMILKLDDSLAKNYEYEKSIFVSTYIINQRKITDFDLIIDGVLRENGSNLINKISVEFDTNEFVDGVVPTYQLVFTKDGEKVSQITSQGVYEVTILFVDGNYYTEMKKSFRVYEPQTFKNLIIIAIVIVVVVGAVIAIIITVKINRKRFKKGVQKEQFKRVKKNLKKSSEVNENAQNNAQNAGENIANNEQNLQQNNQNDNGGNNV